MRKLMKLQSLLSYSSCKFVHFQFSKSQIPHFSSLAKRVRISSRRGETQVADLRKDADRTSLGSLFNEISEILGTENLVSDKTSSGILISKETHLRVSQSGPEHFPCNQTVCVNANESVLQEKKCTQLETLGRNDVSPIVNEIVEVVRAENGSATMVERLEQLLNVNFDSEIVEKVLKRCFKVPYLALRFFNWVKLKDGFCHTTEMFNTILSIAGEVRDFELVEKLVEAMEKNSCKKNIKTWTILISIYGNAKLIGKALFIYNKMKKCDCEPDAGVYKTIIRSLCSAGKPEIAVEFYQEMVQKEFWLDIKMYKMLLNCLARSGDTTSILAVTNDMITLSNIPEHDVYCFVLKSYCISQRIREALEFIRDLKNKGITLGSEYLEILVKGLCSAGRIPEALEIVDIMERKRIVDGKVYGIIINWYLRRNEASKALALFQSVKESGRLPITSTYTQLMQHLFKMNEYQKGFELYDEMQETGIELDSVAFMAMVAGCVGQNDVSAAWEILHRMDEKGIKPNLKFFAVFIKELCKVSRTDEVVKVLNYMQDSKIVIQDELYHWILSYMEKKGETANVEKVKQMSNIRKPFPKECEVCRYDASRLKDPNTEVNNNHSEPILKTYSESDLQDICKILSSSLDWSSIQEKLEKCCVQFTPDLVLEILYNCSMHGHATLHFFNWVGKQAGYTHTTETYNMAIKLAGHGKDFKHMRNLFYETRRKRLIITPDTWTIMIMQYGRIGLTEMALNVFQDMKDSNCIPTSNTYKYLIISLCGIKGRKVNEAIMIFQEMIHSGHVPDKELIETYLACLCKDGKMLDARKCIESLCKVGFTVPLSYSLYVRALCRAGKLDEALDLADNMGKDRCTLDQYIYGSLIHGFLRRGQLEDALKKMDSMKKIGTNPTVHVYTSLIVFFFKEKQIGRALEILAKMLQEGCEPTIVTYSALIHGYMNMGMVSYGWKVFNYIKENGPLPDFRTYSMFITCLCKAGKSEEGLKRLSEMLDSGIVPSNVNFRTVFFGLNREGKQKLALTVLQQKSALKRRRKFLA